MSISATQIQSYIEPATTEFFRLPHNGAEAVVRELVRQKVEVVFGYPGGTILPVFDAITRYNEKAEKPIEVVVPANEQGAAFMAAGYSRSNPDRTGVCITTSGPGATNTITPVYDSWADSIPLIVMSGQVALSAIGKCSFQEAPMMEIMKSITKGRWQPKTADEIETTLKKAFHLAREGRPGPVFIDLSKDVQNAQITHQEAPAEHIQSASEEVVQVLLPEKAMEAINALNNAEKPLVYAGGGVIRGRAAEELFRFCESMRLPVVTTLMGIGVIDTKKPLSMGMLGMHGKASANYAIEDCDALLAVGARFDDRVAGKPNAFAPNAKWIGHIDIDVSEINKIKEASWSHVGSTRETLAALLDKVSGVSVHDHATWHRHLAELKETYRMEYDRNSPLIQPGYLMEELKKIKPDDAIITTGVGQHQMWAAQYLDIKGPYQFITSGSAGTMGFGLPAAIGAWYANPDKTIIDIDGDSSLRMNIGEMETLVNNNIPIKILIVNNSAAGMVKQWEKLFFEGRSSGSDKTGHKKSFTLAAKADGLEFAEQIRNKKEIPFALKKWLTFPGPALLEVIIDPDADVYPMVPIGKGYREMDTGPFIGSR